jgi:hypothetical protein
MGKKAEYQGYTIESAPHRETDWDKWQLHILISVQSPHGIQTREFTADVLYATEEEADIHGMAFGQRVIEGKVDGWSVSDMKIPDRRATPRLRVQFRTTFCASATLEGAGVVHDLSLGGCRIESPVPVTHGVSLELRIHVPDMEWPLMVEAATVQWVSRQTFGLAFLRIKESERRRLEQVIRDVTSKPVWNDHER